MASGDGAKSRVSAASAIVIVVVGVVLAAVVFSSLAPSEPDPVSASRPVLSLEQMLSEMPGRGPTAPQGRGSWTRVEDGLHLDNKATVTTSTAIARLGGDAWRYMVLVSIEDDSCGRLWRGWEFRLAFFADSNGSRIWASPPHVLFMLYDGSRATDAFEQTVSAEIMHRIEESNASVGIEFRPALE